MINLENMSYEELVALNDKIVERLNKMDAIESLQAMAILKYWREG